MKCRYFYAILFTLAIISQAQGGFGSEDKDLSTSLGNDPSERVTAARPGDKEEFESQDIDTQVKWHQRIIDAITPYFNEPYPSWPTLSKQIESILLSQAQSDEQKVIIPKLLEQLHNQIQSDNKITKRDIDGIEYTIYRPNHGLAHGIRQACLASDIVDAFETATKVSEEQNISYFKTMTGKAMMTWVNTKLKDDPQFKKKVEVLAAFQRTGRLSDGGDHKITQIYAKRDQENFTRAAHREFSDVFKNAEEIETYATALIVYPFSLKDLKIIPNDSKNLARLLMAAHYSDLRRVVGYPKAQIRNHIMDYLFGPYMKSQITDDSGEQKFVDILWNRAGEYLNATGESYIDDPKKRSTYDNSFYLQAKDPSLMIKALQSIKEKDIGSGGELKMSRPIGGSPTN